MTLHITGGSTVDDIMVGMEEVSLGSQGQQEEGLPQEQLAKQSSLGGSLFKTLTLRRKKPRQTLEPESGSQPGQVSAGDAPCQEFRQHWFESQVQVCTWTWCTHKM